MENRATEYWGQVSAESIHDVLSQTNCINSQERPLFMFLSYKMLKRSAVAASRCCRRKRSATSRTNAAVQFHYKWIHEKASWAQRGSQSCFWCRADCFGVAESFFVFEICGVTQIVGVAKILGVNVNDSGCLRRFLEMVWCQLLHYNTSVFLSGYWVANWISNKHIIDLICLIFVVFQTWWKQTGVEKWLLGQTVTLVMWGHTDTRSLN